MTDSELKSFDRVAHVYDETRGLPPDIAKCVAEELARILAQVAATPRVVEIGVGTGRIAVPLSRCGVRVTGIDLSPKMLARLREKSGDVDVLLGEASRLPFRSGVFDAALFVHILHLVPDPEATLRAALDLVRPGGLLLEAHDDRTDTARERFDAIVRQTVIDVTGIDIRRSRSYEKAVQAFANAVQAAGASVEVVRLAEWTERMRGRAMLERLARRDYSGSWAIPENAIQAVVDRVAPALEELYGDLDREVEYTRSFSAVVARLPAP